MEETCSELLLYEAAVSAQSATVCL